MNDTDQFHARHDRSVYDLEDIAHHIEWGWMSQGGRLVSQGMS